MTRRPRVLLADDHRIMLEGLRTLLQEEFEVVAAVGDGREMIEAAARLHPDVLVVDISMPHVNGIEAVQRIRESDPEAKVIFLTMHADPTYATRALEAGASGYVLKHEAASDLVAAIHGALAGDVHVSSSVATARREGARIVGLTPRQRDVLRLLADGSSAKEIASTLGISARTVEFHKYRMMESLGVRTTAELIQYAIRHGIVSVQ